MLEENYLLLMAASIFAAIVALGARRKRAVLRDQPRLYKSKSFDRFFFNILSIISFSLILPLVMENKVLNDWITLFSVLALFLIIFVLFVRMGHRE